MTGHSENDFIDRFVKEDKQAAIVRAAFAHADYKTAVALVAAQTDGEEALRHVVATMANFAHTRGKDAIGSQTNGMVTAYLKNRHITENDIPQLNTLLLSAVQASIPQQSTGAALGG